MNIRLRYVSRFSIFYAILSIIYSQELSKPKGESAMSFNFTLTSSAFSNETIIPQKYTCEGEDVSPALHWEHIPVGTKSFVLACLDPGAPPGTWVHWVLYDLNAEIDHLVEGLEKTELLEIGAKQGACWGVDSFSRVGYYGPCPPPGHGFHRYYFTLYALNVETLNLPPKASWFNVEEAMEHHVISQAILMGKYERK